MISLPCAVSLCLVTITCADVGSFMLMIYSIIALTALRFSLIANRRRFIIILSAYGKRMCLHVSERDRDLSKKSNTFISAQCSSVCADHVSFGMDLKAYLQLNTLILWWHFFCPIAFSFRYDVE